MAAELTGVLKGKTVLGLRAVIGVPDRPAGPSVACRVRMQGGEALVQVASSDGTARNWVAFGKFPVKTQDADGKYRRGAARRSRGRGDHQPPGAGPVRQKGRATRAS